MWVFTGGAILVLLQSIYSGMKRKWYQLIIGCMFGGLGSWVASQIWHDSKYLFVICGVAAVVTENLFVGVVNASREFAQNPVKTFSTLAASLTPGMNLGGSSKDKDDE